jgi:hypothetical protein
VPEIKSKERPQEHQTFVNRCKRMGKHKEARNNAAKNYSVGISDSMEQIPSSQANSIS